MGYVSATTVAPAEQNRAFDVVVIAASAGGIHAIRVILAMLPAALPAAILIQTHLNPTYPSVLVDVLRPYSRLPVEWAIDGATLRQGAVTIAPQGQHVRVSRTGLLTLSSWADLGNTKPRADGLFASVAASFQTRALAVVLTGYLDDGARGAQAIHTQGGCVLVQDRIH